MRKLYASVAAAGLVLSLAACTSAPFDRDDCGPLFPAGETSGLVSASGAFGDEPNATFPTPLISESSQSSVIERGDGEPVRADETATVQVTIYDGETGDYLTGSDYAGPGIASTTTRPDTAASWNALAACSTVGSRVAAVGTAQDLIGDTQLQATGLSQQLAPEAPIVIVVDVLAGYLGKADGATQLIDSGFPSVVLAPDGRPGLTLRGGDAPTDLSIATLKKGDGEHVERGDDVVVHYTGVLWDGTEPFESTWSIYSPRTVTAATLEESATGAVEGFTEAIVGSTVGSQVITVVPPEFGFPEGQSPPSIPTGSTLVYVIDVLGIVE